MFELLIWLQEATLARWTQSSGPLCLWQCLLFASSTEAFAYKYIANTLQIHYKYLTNTLQVHDKYINNTFKYITNTLQIHYKSITNRLFIHLFERRLLLSPTAKHWWFWQLEKILLWSLVCWKKDECFNFGIYPPLVVVVISLRLDC